MYTFDIILVHILLSVVLFFIVNWLGSHAISIGYVQMSIAIKDETSPAFNFIFKVLAPPIYIVLCAVLFQTLDLDQMNVNIFYIAVYYWIFRVLWALLTGRSRLVNWIEQSIYWVVSVSLSVWVYSLIEQVEKILPDTRSLLDQFWILIIVFLYSVFNKIQFGREGSAKRGNSYIIGRYKLLHKRYDHLIKNFFHNGFYEALTYSIMIYEDFNRPNIIRWIEYFHFWITRKPHSLGIMQVLTPHYINNEQSINLAMRKICKDTNQYMEELQKEVILPNEYSSASCCISSQYNRGDYSYGDEIQNIFNVISDKFYKNNMPDQVTKIEIENEE